MSLQLTHLPEGLLVLIDDGLAAHLVGMPLPSVKLESINGNVVSLVEIQDRLVLYVYPLTGRPDVALPEGWDETPGARGCTPQACDFSNHHQALLQLNTKVFGLSSQTTDYQLELKNRLHLPFDLLSDHHFQIKNSLNLPVFKVDELVLYKRLTIITKHNVIKKVFYSVFPPNQHATQVIDWSKSH